LSAAVNDPTALGVSLKPGVSPTEGKRAVARALARQGGLEVQTLAEAEAVHERDVQQGIESLGEILTLLLIAAGLAITFAVTATISARRIDSAARKAEGYRASQLWSVLLLESTVVLGVGALVGAIVGFYGHVIASRWLRLGLGFPAPFSPDISQLILTLAIGGLIVLTVAGLVAFIAVRVPPRLSPQE
jgi:predicted lysophospholipase L1 biosynthesis ABC-type transport system permease subunit